MIPSSISALYYLISSTASIWYMVVACIDCDSTFLPCHHQYSSNGIKTSNFQINAYLLFAAYTDIWFSLWLIPANGD